jgi:hypothetical protein
LVCGLVCVHPNTRQHGRNRYCAGSGINRIAGCDYRQCYFHHQQRITIEVFSTQNNELISALKSSQPTSQFKFLVAKNIRDIQLDFEYLEPKQGVNIELLMTGDGEQPTLSGVVLGMPSGFQHY